MPIVDQPNKLYLGRALNVQTFQPLEEPYLLNLRDLVTHAVCLGMTGSGKTGLGITVLEEVLLQGVPAIIIDPKGDITNLGQPQPDGAEPNFQNWNFGIERVTRFHDRVDVRIYTPGSSAGICVNILRSLAAPTELSWARDSEALRDRIAQTVSALLELANINPDPLHSREHILLSTIFESAWRAQQALDVPALIRMIQEPPVARVGVFDLESFIPKSDRTNLALALNNLAASPSFQSWQLGEPLDIAALLKPIKTEGGTNPVGKTRASVFYLAHLSDAERQFFVTLLLANVVSWVRAQAGTSMLKGLLYFDEVYGYCPPYPHNPSAKAPLMALLKQGRASGLGMFLATQNPADLDYKGLSNMGTWFVGHLRTDRDRARALEGMDGAGAGFDAAHAEPILANLPQRCFMVQSSKSGASFMHTRETLSHLTGPLMPTQISEIAIARGWPRAQPAEPAASTVIASPGDAVESVEHDVFPAPDSTQPLLPDDVRETYLHLSLDHKNTLYVPHLLASASARIHDRASGLMRDRRFTYLITLDKWVRQPDYSKAQQLPNFEPGLLESTPHQGIDYAALPPGITSKWMRSCEKALLEHVYRYGVSTVLVNRAFKVYGVPGETRTDFKLRIEPEARARRDAEASRVRTQFAKRIGDLQDQLAAEQREHTQDRMTLDAREREELLTNAESALSFTFARRPITRPLSSGATKSRMSKTAALNLQETEEMITQLRARLQSAARDYNIELNAINDKWMAALNKIDEISMVPRKSDVFSDVVAIAWVA